MNLISSLTKVSTIRELSPPTHTHPSPMECPKSQFNNGENWVFREMQTIILFYTAQNTARSCVTLPNYSLIWLAHFSAPHTLLLVSMTTIGVAHQLNWDCCTHVIYISKQFMLWVFLSEQDVVCKWEGLIASDLDYTTSWFYKIILPVAPQVWYHLSTMVTATVMRNVWVYIHKSQEFITIRVCNSCMVSSTPTHLGSNLWFQ